MMSESGDFPSHAWHHTGCRRVRFVIVTPLRWPPLCWFSLCDYSGTAQLWRDRALAAAVKYPGVTERRRQAALFCIGGRIELQAALVHWDRQTPRTAGIIADMIDNCRLAPGWPR